MHFRSIYFEIKGMYTITYSIKNMKRYILFIAQVVQFDDYINMSMFFVLFLINHLKISVLQLVLTKEMRKF